MSNMSYCRFANTSSDLTDCLYALKDGENISSIERVCGKEMFRNFLTFCKENDIIDDFSWDVIKQLFDENDGDDDDE